LLNNLGGLYVRQNRFTEAEPLLRRSLKIREKVRGVDHPETGRSVAFLATFYSLQSLYEPAEPLWRRALSIAERSLGVDVPETRGYAHSLALTLRKLNRSADAHTVEEKYKSAS
jgi:hypothetical protein